MMRTVKNTSLIIAVLTESPSLVKKISSRARVCLAEIFFSGWERPGWGHGHFRHGELTLL